MECWAIKDWDEVFEDRRSREVKRLKYVPLPLDRNSEAAGVLMLMDGGAAAYGIFIRLAMIAARMPVRGILSDEKGELTVARMARRVGCHVNTMQAAVDILSSPEIGWLVRKVADVAPPTKQVTVGCSADKDPTIPHVFQKSADAPPTESPKNGAKKHTEQNITEQQQQRGADAAAAFPEEAVKAEARAALIEVGITENTRSELVGLPHITAKIVREEAAKATKAGKGLGVVVLSLRSRCSVPPKTTTRHIESTGSLQANGKLVDFDRSTLTETDREERRRMWAGRKSRQGGAA